MTTTSSATRAADVATKGFAGGSEGTLVVEVSADDLSADFSIIELNDGTANNRIQIKWDQSASAIKLYNVASASNDVDLGTTSWDGSNIKIAIGYRNNEYIISVDGGAVETDTTATVPTVDTVQIGASQVDTSIFGNYPNVTYYPYRFNDSQYPVLSA